MSVESLWSDYRNQVKRYLHFKIGNEADVEDLLQEVMTRSYENLDQLTAPEKAKSWLFQITKNTVIDFYRKNGRTYTDRDLWYDTMDEAEEEHAFAPCLVPFIKALPEETAKALIAIDLEGQSQKEYSEIYGIPYSTLKSRVQTGRKNLKKLFQDCCAISLDRWGNVIEYEPKNKQGCKIKKGTQ